MILNCMSNLNIPLTNYISYDASDIVIVSNISHLHDYNLIKNFFKKFDYSKEIIFVPGVQDILFDHEYKMNTEYTHNHYHRKFIRNIYNKIYDNELDIIILRDDYIELDLENIVSIYGQCYSNDYKFNNSEIHKYIYGNAHLKNESELENLRNNIKSCDILITSYPPYSILDNNMGCKYLLNRVLNIKPKYHIFNGFDKSCKFIFNNINFINSNIYNNNKKSIILSY
ncbi:metallophosphoesterase domain-containing protein [Alphaentomopoxvirus acuprea]|uniref:Metallophosphoesterase domain-containing protein n=1 Tax=Alphaentomopoxvirus acuprea TaxID=62099 RepID=W6JLB8_9POXV|nr:metallophosphoesterase domain-containing protein [Anomala cuprea entomopoxvirus]BAO49421.1 metallophosphoesterase domain-containing protein [Anomala cuprea entomopoxvirus]